MNMRDDSDQIVVHTSGARNGSASLLCHRILKCAAGADTPRGFAACRRRASWRGGRIHGYLPIWAHRRADWWNWYSSPLSYRPLLFAESIKHEHVCMPLFACPLWSVSSLRAGTNWTVRSPSMTPKPYPEPSIVRVATETVFSENKVMSLCSCPVATMLLAF
jgi:hypothetical protein